MLKFYIFQMKKKMSHMQKLVNMAEEKNLLGARQYRNITTDEHPAYENNAQVCLCFWIRSKK